MARPRNTGGSQDTAGADELLNEPLADETVEATKPKKRNDGIDLSPFNYSGNFVGETFKNYEEITNGKFARNELRQLVPVTPGLLLHQQYDFEGYKVEPIRALKNPDNEKDQSTELIGFRFLDTTPVRTSTTAYKNIKILNDQIRNAVGKQPMIYYLLKK